MQTLDKLRRAVAPLARSGQQAALRSLGTRAKQHSESESEHVPVVQKGPSSKMQQTPRRGSSEMPPWPIGGGLTSILPSLPSMLMTNPFGASSVGPWGMADRLLHELEDEMRSLVASGEEDAQEAVERAMEPGRLWAAVDVVEGPNDFKLSTDVPGLSKSDIKVVLEDNVLRLSGERRRCETKEGEGWKRSERSYGMFERRFRVPPNTDPLAIKADISHGVLHVTIPKKEEKKPAPVQIEVGGGNQQPEPQASSAASENDKSQKKA